MWVYIILNYTNCDSIEYIKLYKMYKLVKKWLCELQTIY